MQKKENLTAHSPFTVGINNLPYEVLTEIFLKFSTKDCCRAARVCHTWRDVLKSRRRVAQRISARQLVKYIPSLQPSVTHLKLIVKPSRCGPLALTYHQIIVKINERSPSLETLILEGAFLLNVCSFTSFTRYCTRNSKASSDRSAENWRQWIVSHPKRTKRQKREDLKVDNYIHLKYCEKNNCFNAVLPKLTVLSLESMLFCVDFQSHSFKETCFFFSHFVLHVSTLQNLKVLNLSRCEFSGFTVRGPRTSEIGDLFSTMTYLEELYLEDLDIIGTNILPFIETAKKLRVLDVENTSICERDGTCERDIISALKQNGKFIEELYLSFNDIGDFYTADEQEVFFPRLKKMCVLRTSVTAGGVEKLLQMCPLLSNINVTENVNSESWMQHLPENMKKKIVLYNDGAWRYPLSCQHFKDSKHNTWDDIF